MKFTMLAVLTQRSGLAGEKLVTARKKSKIHWTGQIVILSVSLWFLFPIRSWAQYKIVVVRETVSALPESEINKPVPALTGAQRQALIERYLARREAMDAANNTQAAASELRPESLGGKEAVEIVPGLEPAFHAPPGGVSSSFLGRNLQNTRANSNLGSPLAETSAVNEGPYIFYTGNTHSEYSLNGGSTYTNVPTGAGPSAAPFDCCDLDSVYDKGRGVTIWSVLYRNSTSSTGVVRIFVRRHIPLANNCAYDYAPGPGIVPDYPHLGLSNDFLYLTTNEGATHRIGRYNLDQLVDCATVAPTRVSVTPAVGQRVVVPVEGATDTMYWAYHDSPTVIRIGIGRRRLALLGALRKRSICTITQTRTVAGGFHCEV